jgi:hypothetical protein
MPHINHYLPELDEPERPFLVQLTATMSELDIQRFASAYRRGRKDPQTIMLKAVIGSSLFQAYIVSRWAKSAWAFSTCLLGACCCSALSLTSSSTRSSRLGTTGNLQDVSRITSFGQKRGIRARAHMDVI